MPPQSYHIKIGDGRRVVLPSEVCKLMSLAVGDTIVVRVENNKATLSSVEQTIVRFQALLAKKIPQDVSMVDALITEREEASRRE